MAIGVFYAIKEKHKTTEQYLMADRSLQIVPASVSLMISYLSAVTLLGDSTEAYFYGITFSLYIFSTWIAVIIVAELFVPLFHPLRVTSLEDVSQDLYILPLREENSLLRYYIRINTLKLMHYLHYFPSI